MLRNGREGEQMSHKLLVMLCATVLVGAIWAVRPETIPMVSSSRAQTVANSPVAFTGALTELPSIEKLRIRHSVYVAAYSTVRLASGKARVNLATTLIIHNTSEKVPLILLRADYFDTAGNLLEGYLPSPIAIRPLGSVETFVSADDTRGGTGANFVVEWGADGQITEPLIEAVMIGQIGTSGFSITSRGKTMTIATP
jgi:hypothetical protein